MKYELNGIIYEENEKTGEIKEVETAGHKVARENKIWLNLSRQYQAH